MLVVARMCWLAYTDKEARYIFTGLNILTLSLTLDRWGHSVTPDNVLKSLLICNFYILVPKKSNGQHMTDHVSRLLNISNYWCTTPQSICFLHMKWLKIRLPELSTTPPRKTGSLVLSLVDNLFIKLARWWASQPQVQTASGRSTWPQVLPETCLALAALRVLQTMPNASLSEPPWKSADCRFRRLPTQLTQKSEMWLFKMFWLVQDTTKE